MRRALGIASVFTILTLAGPALAQANDGSSPAELVPGATTGIAGGPAGSVFPAPAYGGVRSAERVTPRKVYAVVGRRLVSGEASPAGGQLVLKDEASADFLCVGRFQQARHGGPTVRLACSDGSRVRLTTTAFTEDSGFARRSAASLTYGFRAKEAAKRLAAPAGYVLVTNDDRLVLKPAGA